MLIIVLLAAIEWCQLSGLETSVRIAFVVAVLLGCIAVALLPFPRFGAWVLGAAVVVPAFIVLRLLSYRR